MAVYERDVVLTSKDKGNETIDFPVTRLGLIEDGAGVKGAPEDGDAIPVIDGSDGFEMKKVLWSAVKGALSAPVDENAAGLMTPELLEELNGNTAATAAHAAQLQQLESSYNYAVCTTAGNVAAKTVNISPFVLNAGVEVTINFAYANTTPAITLNVSGTGAKAVMYRGTPPQGNMLKGVQKFSYDGTNWNVVGDIDTNTDTTYEIMSASEALAGSAVTARTINAPNLKQAIMQISGDIVNASMAEGYDVGGLQAALNDLIFRLAAQGVIDGDGLDTVVTIDSADDVVLVSGIYADGKVYI